MLSHKLLSVDRLYVRVMLESVELGLSDEPAQGVWKVTEER